MKRKVFILVALLVALVLTLAACGGGASSVFGDVQIHNSGTGQRGIVTVARSVVTDEALLEFFHEHIDGSGLNFFTIDFGDGTGFVFPSSRNRFTHSTLDNSGAGIDTPAGTGLSGSIYADHIIYSTFYTSGDASGIYEVHFDNDSVRVYRVDRVEGTFVRDIRDISPLRLQLD